MGFSVRGWVAEEEAVSWGIGGRIDSPIASKEREGEGEGVERAIYCKEWRGGMRLAALVA